MAGKYEVKPATVSPQKPVTLSDGTIIELIDGDKPVLLRIKKPRLQISSRRDREQEEGA